MIDRPTVNAWLTELKEAWEAGDGDRALRLFTSTDEYYERPFKAATTQEQIRKYWEDIDGLQDIKFDFSIAAIDGQLAVVHWQNSFITPGDAKSWLLDGVFFIEFDDDGHCVRFRQWWFGAE